MMAKWCSSVCGRSEAWSAREGSLLGLGLFRIIVGLMALRNAAGYLRDWSNEGFYGEFFSLPYTSLIPQPSETIYLAALAAAMLGGGGLIVGLYTRSSAIVTFVAVTYQLSLNEIWYRHNRYFLVLALFLLCLTPCGRALSIDSLRRNLSPIGPVWGFFLIKAQMTLIYLASAVSKTLDPAWRKGHVLAGRDLIDLWQTLVPMAIQRAVDTDLVIQVLTTSALFTEFFLAIFLWIPWTRRLAIWCGFFFHGFIEIQYSVLTFTYLTLGTYFIFAELEPGAKTLILSSRGRLVGVLPGVVRTFDWLFQIRLALHADRVTRFIDRDGRSYSGLMAWIMLGANLPVLFPFCYPVALIRYLTPRRTEKVSAVNLERSRSPAKFWLLGATGLYLLFLWAVNVQLASEFSHDERRFWDLPWFLLLMCLVAKTYNGSLLGEDRAGPNRSSNEPRPSPTPTASTSAG